MGINTFPWQLEQVPSMRRAGLQAVFEARAFDRKARVEMPILQPF
jgi:hypothetical protein